MSYCRWSSENYRSDVYVYASGDESYHTNVAGNRLMWRPIPRWPSSWYPDFGGKWDEENFKVVYSTKMRTVLANVVYSFIDGYNRLHHWSFRFILHKSIEDELAGESFTDNSPKECVDRLLMLRGRGYYVPQGAIDGLVEEDRASTGVA